jgi:hypothetical protein
LPSSRAKKPGFPLQVLGFAYANPVGFPLQSLARQIKNRPGNCPWQFPGRRIAKGNSAALTRRRQFASQIAHKGSSKNFHFVISRSKGKNCCENSNFFLCVVPAIESF